MYDIRYTIYDIGYTIEGSSVIKQLFSTHFLQICLLFDVINWLRPTAAATGSTESEWVSVCVSVSIAVGVRVCVCGVAAQVCEFVLLP